MNLYYTESNSVLSGIKIKKGAVEVLGGLTLNQGGLNVNSDSLSVANNVDIDFYSALDMHGFPIYNQSDIRLKENITAPTISGISETKRIKMAEFDFRRSYDNRILVQQRPGTRQFGIIAQSSPFLSKIVNEKKNHYLSVDLNKQINLNTLTNQELIQKVEMLEKKIVIKSKGRIRGRTKCRKSHYQIKKLMQKN